MSKGGNISADNKTLDQAPEDEKLQPLIEQARLDREGFRAQAVEVLTKFTPQDRNLAENLESKTATAKEVLQTWAEKLRPLRQQLQEKRTSPVFKKLVATNLQVDDLQAHTKIEHLIDERQQEALHTFIDTLYPPIAPHKKDHYKTQRVAAINLFGRSDDDIQDFYDRYINYINHQLVSKKQAVTVCDPAASWAERRRCARQTRREQNGIIREERRVLARIQKELAVLKAAQNGLVGQIIQYDWDFETIEKLYQAYHKRAKGQASPAKRLQIFDDTTRRFRDETATLHANNLENSGLKAIRQLADDIDKLLLHAFDLKESDREELGTLLQRCRDLKAEQQTIATIQKNRQRAR